ncbi:MAG: linear amide C-N hydrolase [Armatimonadetes bacterium]|nr:linear amide C-N hydrolase [Armatimonadota bacterium]
MRPAPLTLVFVSVLIVLCPAACLPCTDVLATREPWVVSARTMDWRASMLSRVVIRPRGIERRASDCPPDSEPLQWTARYGSVTVRSFIDVSTSEGLNERGLSAALLWLSDSRYAQPAGKPVVTPMQWGQFFLDTCATVDEAVEKAKEFDVVPLQIPLWGSITDHLVLRDATGDSAVLEWLDRRLVVHHPLPIPAVANEPPCAEMLTRVAAFDGLGGAEPMPYDFSSVARCARASLWAQRLPRPQRPTQAVAYAFDVIQTVCRPPGDRVVTLWASVRDHTNLTFHYRTLNDPQVVSFDLKALDFSPGRPETVLDMHADQTGDIGP